MTEAKWLACRTTAPMLELLERRTSQRKLLLFACACCRQVSTLLLDARSRTAQETIERWADREVSIKEARAADRASLRAWRWASFLGWPFQDAAFAVRLLAAQAVRTPPTIAGVNPIEEVAHHARSIAHSDSLAEALEIDQVAYLHDIFGNPYRAMTIAPPWLKWNEGTIPRLAQVIYKDRSFDHLPILADALEEAGCTNSDILNHCRQPGEHVRGCWVIDLLLGKE